MRTAYGRRWPPTMCRKSGRVRRMSDQGIRPGSQPTIGREVAIVVAAVAVMVLGMVAFYFYPYPSGERPDALSVVVFWLRELVILSVVGVVLVMLVVARLRRVIQRELRGEDHAP